MIMWPEYDDCTTATCTNDVDSPFYLSDSSIIKKR